MGQGPPGGGQGLGARAGEHRGDRIEEDGVEGACRTHPFVVAVVALPAEHQLEARRVGEGEADVRDPVLRQGGGVGRRRRQRFHGGAQAVEALDGQRRLQGLAVVEVAVGGRRGHSRPLGQRSHGEALAGLEHLRGVGQQRRPQIAVVVAGPGFGGHHRRPSRAASHRR